jgi:serine/threonine-protein kinase
MRLIGRYLLCDVIASGGMATVHLARLVGPEGFSRTVAIKQLYHHFARDQEFVAMFLDEARILSRIRHPNVVAPLDVIVLDGELFIVMEYVHGASLAELMEASAGPIPPRIVSAVVGQMLLGLHAAHEATAESGEPLSIVHRDVSPHNVLVGGDGIARVVDFGIAKAHSRARTTGDGSIKGKLGYMAPEQLRNQPVDRRTDLFTSGTVLWEALTGQRLFLADNVAGLFDKLVNTDTRLSSSDLSLPAELEQVVSRALALDPAERIATARELAVELERAVPPASTLETSAWVESLVGPMLSRRSERIAQLEAVDIADLTLARQRLEPPAAGASLQPRALDSSELSRAVPSPTNAALSGVPVSRDLGSPTSARKRSLGILLLTSLSVVLALAAAAIYRTQTPESAVRVVPAALSPEPSAELAMPGAPRPPASSPMPLAPPRTLSAELPAADGGPFDLPVPAKAVSGGRPRAATKAAARSAPRGKCAVPYTLDEHGVKRFKAECF